MNQQQQLSKEFFFITTSVLMSVVAAHLASNDFFSVRLLFYSNCQFFNLLNHQMHTAID